MRFFKALAAAVAVCPATLVALVVPHSVIYGGPANDSPVRHAVMSHTLPDLPYAYDALEPYISRQIMELHHKKHHQAYVNGLNAAEDSYAKASTVRERIALQSAIKFNGGGDINHSLFWKNLAPARSAGKGNGGILKEGKLKDAIVSTFGSVDSFIKEFNAATAAIQGSGWGWLGFDPKTGSLEITTTPNQDPLLSHLPILGVDIWEHAFYLQYLNVKADYLNSIWSVINWEEAEKRYNEGLTAPKPCIACSHIIPQSQPN